MADTTRVAAARLVTPFGSVPATPQPGSVRFPVPPSGVAIGVKGFNPSVLEEDELDPLVSDLPTIPEESGSTEEQQMADLEARIAAKKKTPRVSAKPTVTNRVAPTPVKASKGGHAAAKASGIPQALLDLGVTRVPKNVIVPAGPSFTEEEKQVYTWLKDKAPACSCCSDGVTTMKVGRVNKEGANKGKYFYTCPNRSFDGSTYSGGCGAFIMASKYFDTTNL